MGCLIAPTNRAPLHEPSELVYGLLCPRIPTTSLTRGSARVEMSLLCTVPVEKFALLVHAEDSPTQRKPSDCDCMQASGILFEYLHLGEGSLLNRNYHETVHG